MIGWPWYQVELSGMWPERPEELFNNRVDCFETEIGLADSTENSEFVKQIERCAGLILMA